MNREQLSDAIGRLDEALVGSVMMPRRRPWWQIAVAVAACIALVIGAVAVWPLIGPDGQRPPMEPSHGNVTTTSSEQGGTEEGQTTDTTVGSVSEPSDTTDREPSDSTTDGGDVEPSMKPTAKPSMQRPTAGTKGTTVMKNPNGFTTVTTTTAPTIKTTATKATKNTGGGVRGTKTTIRKGTTTGGGQSDSVVKRLAYPTYPEMVQRPYDSFGADYVAWDESVKKQRDQIKGQTDGMTDFYRRTINMFLDDESGENRVYSPLNVYLALSMLAETTEGESRQQILDLLGVSKLSTLRKKNAALWNGVYMDDGATLCRLSNSLWLSDYLQEHYIKSTTDILAKHYYASVYAGKMGSEIYNKKLQNWVDEQTDGLLKDQAGSLGFRRDTVLGLASTICFRAKWNDQFNPEDTEKGVFYTSKGEKTCYYLRAETDGYLRRGDRFTALTRVLNVGYTMLFFRPDEGVSASDLIQDEQVLELMQGNRSNVDEIHDFIDISIPKFDVVSDLDLSDGLNKLGVTDIFDDKTSDFGGILDDRYSSAYVSQMQHAARVKIDEEGVEATAYVVNQGDGDPTPKDPIEFKLDRPFVFAITGPGNTVLFAGVVENP